MKNKTIAMIFKLPLLLVMIGSFFVSIYAAINGIQGITVAIPIIFGVIIILYFIGRRLDKISRDSY